MHFFKLTLFLFLVITGVSTTVAGEKQRLRLSIVEPYLEIHTGPANGYPIHFVAQRGEVIEILKRRTEWYKVRIQVDSRRQKTGWVHADDIANTIAVDTKAIAQEHPRLKRNYDPKFSAGFSVGQFSNADIVGGLINYALSQTAAVELYVNEYFGLDEEGLFAGGQLIYQPWRIWRLSPLVSIGYGYVERDFKGSLIQQSDLEDNFLQTGSGIDLHLSDRYRLRFEYKHLNILTSTDDNKELEAWSLNFVSKL